VEKAGANFLAICTNTMHMMADKIQENINIPLLHIADATAEAIKGKGLIKVGLLGTKFTMEHDFYKDRFAEKHGIGTIIPDEKGRKIVNAIIYNELCLGKFHQHSKDKLIKIMEHLIANGAQGIVLGCTEIPLLIQQKEVAITLFNTTEIHAKSIVENSI
jgi:aspartate racemase